MSLCGQSTIIFVSKHIFHTHRPIHGRFEMHLSLVTLEWQFWFPNPDQHFGAWIALISKIGFFLSTIIFYVTTYCTFVFKINKSSIHSSQELLNLWKAWNIFSNMIDMIEAANQAWPVLSSMWIVGGTPFLIHQFVLLDRGSTRSLVPSSEWSSSQTASLEAFFFLE